MRANSGKREDDMATIVDVVKDFSPFYLSLLINSRTAEISVFICCLSMSFDLLEQEVNSLFIQGDMK